LHDRTRAGVVDAGRIVWPLQFIAATENGCAVRCVTPQRPSRSMENEMENEHECGVRSMIRRWHAGTRCGRMRRVGAKTSLVPGTCIFYEGLNAGPPQALKEQVKQHELYRTQHACR
jgi:hypothetical protein